MTWSRFWALTTVTALGCSREVAPGPEIKEPAASTSPARDAPRPPPPTPVATSVPTPPSSPSPPPAPPPPTFFSIELAPTQGDLVPLLVTQVERARAKQLRVLVEFYADWCPPCRAFQENLEEPRMKEALTGTYLVKLNLDDWHDKLKGTGYVARAIPVFYLVGPDGRPAGKMLDGDKWGKSTPANMSAALSKFLGH